ncbi:MAG: T9SS type A sorting domain-containing protein [Flavobacteriales bacterium]|nr:T9SS type A sorting domain-containing protein [Flavobacteriales bacterium]
MKKIVLALATFLATITLNAQEQALPCGLIQATEAARAKYPGLYELELQLAATEAGEEESESSGNERAVKVIPVVVHILHNYGNENISDAQVHDAIRILNEDFQKRQPDTANIASAFKPIQGDVQFEFRLARKDPNGNCTNGITRTVTTHTFNANEDAKTVYRNIWPRNRYLNVWVVQKLENGAGGYTYTPGTANWLTATDGIILVNRQFGGIGTSTGGALARRTLSHEVGHWFNLQHTWGSSNTPGLANNCNGDDGVSDTPNTIGVGNQSCNTAQNTCSSLDNIQNIMDYSACPIMFTVGQANRMINASNSSTAQRNNLWTTNNLNFTGVNDGFSDTLCAPVADFNGAVRVACVGSPIVFQDLSYNGVPDTWTWTFANTTDGVTTVTSNDQNPSVTFDTPGLYNVSLNVANTEGSNFKNKIGYVRVNPTEAMSFSNGFFEDFEGNVNTNGWFTVNDDDASGWQPSSLAGSSGTKSYSVRNFLSKTGYEVYDLISPTYDLSQINSPKLRFKYAYTNRATDNTDRLRVYISTNCGTSWLQLTPFITNANMVTAPVTNASFVPNASQWVEKEFSLSSTFASSTRAMFKFEFTTGGGNNFYLDDVNIAGVSSVENWDAQSATWEIFPNPADDYVDITFASENSISFDDNLLIYDAAGRVVQSLSLQGTVNTIRADVSTLGSGIYFIRSEKGTFAGTRKLIVR